MAGYKRKKVDNSLEHMLATGVIVSDRVVRELRTIYNSEYIEIPYVQMVCTWAIEYYERYNRAPGADIQEIARSHIRHDPRFTDDDTKAQMEDFLATLSDNYTKAEKFNSGYLLDEVENLFKSKSLQHKAEDVIALLSDGNVLGAEAEWAGYEQVGRPQSKGENPYGNMEATQAAFEHAATPLFQYPGYYGRLVNRCLVRGGLVAKMGKTKIGKTFGLMEDAYRALRYGNNTAFFGVGDMTTEEIDLRMYIRRARCSNDLEYCGAMMVPIMDCRKNQDDTCTRRHRACNVGLGDAETFEDAPTDYVACDYCARRSPNRYVGAVWYKQAPAVDPLDWRQAYKQGVQFKKVIGERFQRFHFDNDTANVDDIDRQLQMLKHFKGWIPDVVIIDYADILADQPNTVGNNEKRHTENAKWKALRRLATKWNCLVLTATQADAAAYYSERINLSNFNEARTKADHCTLLLGLNQVAKEKRAGILRINVLIQRVGEFDEDNFAVVLQCLQRGTPYIGSYKLIPGKRKKKKKEKDE